MSEQLRESLSAAMDDEADAFELRRVLDEAKVDAELREQWHRLHMVRDVLRDEAANYHPQLRERVWAALKAPDDDDAETTELVLAEAAGKAGGARSPWLGRVTGVAVAATVAAAVILTGGSFDDTVDAPALVDNTPADLTPVMHQQIHPEDRQRVDGLMLHHFQNQAINSPGVQSFVKLATFRYAPMLPPTRPQAGPTLPQAGTGEQSAP